MADRVNDLPEEIPPEWVDVVKPPAPLVRDLREGKPVCGGRVEFEWPAGEFRGKALTLYCAEPKCMTEGECTGPRFVPHIDQYTHLDPDAPGRKTRKLTVKEIVLGIERATLLASERGARPSLAIKDRDQIAKYAGMVWRRTLKAIRGNGNWSH